MKKGIVLAGGRGTRLLPWTKNLNKHAALVYDKPMVLYPLETLKSLFIRDILLVSGGNHIGWFTEFLGDGHEYGVNLTYKVQEEAGGIAEALGLARDFVGDEPVVVILGDNVFDNNNFFQIIPSEDLDPKKAHIFVKEVDDPERFGVLNPDGSIEEKPKEPKSNKAITGIYIYPPSVFDIVSTLKPSDRGELEISHVNNEFIRRGQMEVHEITGFWSDAGQFDSLLKSALWAQKLQHKNNQKGSFSSLDK